VVPKSGEIQEVGDLDLAEAQSELARVEFHFVPVVCGLPVTALVKKEDISAVMKAAQQVTVKGEVRSGVVKRQEGVVGE
jgi:hypothetical protein